MIAVTPRFGASPDLARTLAASGSPATIKTASVSAPTRPSVCFVAPNAYGALSEATGAAHVGGAERQQVLLGEELVRRGYRVSFVVLDHGQPDGEMLRGIRVLKCYRADRGVRGLRFFHPRLTGLWNAMKRADADVYYQRGAEAETGLVGHWCRRHARGFIFAVAHDTNCMPATPLITWFERFLFHYGLRRADAVITQTLGQQRMLREAFGMASTVVRSCSAWPPDFGEPAECGDRAHPPDRILWVGRLSPEKRPEWLTRLATELPPCRFEVVGHSNTHSKYGRTLAAQLAALPNVRWHGYVEHSRMRALYRTARLLLCTSESEGFPNTFLEAWSCGTPVLTSVDPDGVVAKFQLGRVATDYLALSRHLRELPSQRSLWEASGHRGQQYVREHHTAAAAGDILERVIQTCYQQSRRRRRSRSALLPGL
jgi:glycosyltransferase involved in cell wall biosynthesis